jgi:hypothetical protein
MPMSLVPRVRNKARSFVWRRWWAAPANSRSEKFWLNVLKNYF